MNKSVLVIDDDEAFQFYMKSLFEKHFHVKLFKAFDGKEALDLVSELVKLPDIIFLDLNMPIMDGHDFLKAWQRMYSNSHTRIVIVSSSEAKKDRDSTQFYDCVKDYVVKPEVADKINKHIEEATQS